MRLALVALLVAPAMLAGCFKEEPAPAIIVRPTPYFNFNGAQLHEGYHSDEGMVPAKLIAKFETNVATDLEVLNEHYETVGSAYGIAAYSVGATIELTAWEAIPEYARGVALTLRAIEADTGNLTFEGPVELAPMDVVLEKVDLYQARGTVAGADVELVNRGEIPAFIHLTELDVSGTPLTLVLQHPDGVEPPLAKVIQPGERKKLTLRGDVEAGLDAYSYAPPGDFTVTVRLRYHNGEPTEREFSYKHEMTIVDVEPTAWDEGGVRTVEVTVETKGNFPVALSAARWGFRTERTQANTEELGLGEIYIAEPNRQYKIVLTDDQGRVRPVSGEDTSLAITLLDPSGQIVAAGNATVPQTGANLTSFSVTWTCDDPGDGSAKDCTLAGLSFYAEPTSETPVYLSGFRISQGTHRHLDRREVPVGAVFGAREQHFEIGGFTFPSVKQGTTVKLRIEALHLNGSPAGVAEIDAKAT